MVSSDVIQEYADRVAAAFRPERIILFGSHATGRAGPASDVDLLVVMPDGGDALGTSIEIARRIPHHGFALDLIVRDPDDLTRRAREGDFFLREVLREGKPLYERDRR